MRRKSIYRLNWAMPVTLLIMLVVAGCGAPLNPPTEPPAASPVPETAIIPETAPTSDTSLPTTEPAGPTPTSPPEGNIKYQDDFSNASTQWADATLGHYHVGYHEPEWYEVEVKSPNSEAPIVPIPTGETYGDATMELEVNTFSNKTAAEGDFQYGLVFRRSGDLWYGFFISQPTKTWFVVKNTPAGPQVLGTGVEESIHDRDANDLLRVDAQGASFLFHLNDKLVEQVTDADYANGEIGLYVKTVDSPQAHIHFDSLTIAQINLSLACTIPEGGTVNVRSGPGKAYSSIAVLNGGDTVQATGKSPNQWIQVVVEGSSEPGWISYSFEGGELACTPSVDLFPVVNLSP